MVTWRQGVRMGQPRLAALQMIGCPRCGYDQRGTIAAWDDWYPLAGTCAECGLEFSWWEIIHSHKYQPKWCVEFVARRRVVRGCWLTLFRSLMPPRFWSRLQM